MKESDKTQSFGESTAENVLIVTKNVSVMQELCEMLTVEYNIITAQSVVAAKELLSEQSERISIILLDSESGDTGISEVMYAAKHACGNKTIPVIVISTKSVGSFFSVQNCGADDVITSPFNDNEVRRRVKNTLLYANNCYSHFTGKLTVLQNACTMPNSKVIRPARDSLTGLYVRKTARKIIEKTLDLHNNGPYVMILLDIDDFKSINDSCGVGFGNRALMSISKKIDGMLGDNGVAARAGGDEFMIFIQCINAVSDVRKIFDELCADLELYAVSPSFGVSVYPVNGVLYDELYHKADVALQNAKQTHNRMCFYSDKMPDFPHIHTPIVSNSGRIGSSNGFLPA